MGPEKVIASAEAISKRIKEASRSGEKRPVVVVAMDGAHMPTRPAGGRGAKRGPGEYKEAKGFRIYLNAGGRITHLASWHRIGTKEEIQEALELAASRIPTDRVRIGLIRDGAHWLWEVIAKTIQYLERNKQRIHYRGDRIGGYPIGSGGIESANKFICHTRLKRSGAWWLKANGNKMLAIRCSIVNDTFDEIFSLYASQEKAGRLCTNG